MDDEARAPELVGSLFRREAGKLTAALARVLGLHHLDLCEDIVQDTLCQALEVWKYHPIPDNPAAWLMRAARNRAIDLIRREKTRRKFAPDLTELLESEWTLVPTFDAQLMPGEVRDGQLRMMFSCAAPGIPDEAQVALILKILCGFSVAEIAAASLTSPAAVEKQISRGKAVLAEARALFDVAGAELGRRLGSVHSALYLLFNEGYHGSHPELAVRAELCREALRLAELLASHPAGNTPPSHALVALCALHLGRLPGRIDDRGALVLLEDQDRARWDGALIRRGLEALDRSSSGDELSVYHVEGGIAALHASAPSFAETDWAGILRLYDVLVAMRPGPVTALARAIVVGQVHGPDAGLAALAAIPEPELLRSYPFYFGAAAELHGRAGRREEARAGWRRALAVARNPSEIELIERRLLALG
jgi:RNA polymerase sigma-70 factor (ECF subfamily)